MYLQARSACTLTMLDFIYEFSGLVPFEGLDLGLK